MTHPRKVIIIGSGPAGHTAAQTVSDVTHPRTWYWPTQRVHARHAPVAVSTYVPRLLLAHVWGLPARATAVALEKPASETTLLEPGGRAATTEAATAFSSEGIILLLLPVGGGAALQAIALWSAVCGA